MSAAGLLKSALGDDAPPAGLGAFASELRAALVARWGEVGLPHAPAF